MSVVQNYMQEDSILIDKIVYELKSQGIFDHFRKECIADVDTKPAYQNLRQRVEGSVGGFLSKQKWSPDMNKNQVREMLRKNIYESGFLETGVERIVDQVVNPKINSIFLPKVTEVVYKFFGIETEKKNQTAADLLPTDLEAVSPESEKPDDSNLDDSKIDEDESPPFEPLEEQSTYVPPEDNSIDSHMSGFSELDSNLSSKPLIVDTSNQDSMASKQSSDGRLSIVMSETDTGEDDAKSKKNFENLNEKIRKDDRSKSKSYEKSRSRSEKDRKDLKDSKDLKDLKDSKDSKDLKDSKYSSSKDRDKSSSKNGKSEHRDKERSKSHSSSSHRHSSSHRSKESSSKDRSKDKERSSKDNKHKDEKRKSHHSESKSSDKHKRDSHSSKSSSSRSRDSKKDPKKDKDASENDNCKKRTDRRSTDRDSNDGQSGLKSSSGSFDSLTSSQVSQQGKSTESNSNSTSNGDSGNSDAHEDSSITVLEEITDEISISAQSLKNNKQKIRNHILSESENKENKSEVKKADVPESPPLRSVAVSAASWEALEAKLNESVANEQYYQQSYYDSPDTPEKEDEKVVVPPVGDDCHYFERESCSKTERYVKFVSDLVGKLEKNIEKVEHSAIITEHTIDLSSSKEEIITSGLKRKLIDTNSAVKQCNKRFNIEVHENFPLPLSPAESDNSVDKKSDISETSDRRNDVGDMDKAKRNLRAPAKKQRYSSEDLYKPRPFFSGSRRRSGRNIGGVD